MSSAFWFFRATRDLASAQDVDEHAMQPLGSSEDVKALVSSAFPTTRWSINGGTLWGSLALDGELLEIMIGKPGAPQSMISVRASARTNAAAVLQKLSNALQMVCLDRQTMDLVKPAT